MKERKGFTLIELLIVIAIIGILATVMMASLIKAKKKAYTAKASAELRNMAIGMKMHLIDYADYPADVAPGIKPANMDQFMNTGGWPTSGAWPDSVYDWDNWPAQGSFSDTKQISVRFCRNGINNSCMPNESWANNFTTQSAFYYCIEGDCRAWEASDSVPGYCLNC